MKITAVLTSLFKSLPFRQHYVSLDGSKGKKPKQRSNIFQNKKIIASWSLFILFIWLRQQGLLFATGQRDYILKPLPIFGMEVHGLDLSNAIHPDTFKALKEDAVDHKLLLFKRQNLTEAQHLAFAKLFGENNVPFPDGSHPGVAKLLNSDGGDVNSLNFPDTQYWHIDGVYYQKPPIFVIQHMKIASSVCSTKYINTNKFLEECATPEQIQKWDTTFVRNKQKDAYSPWYPLITQHPTTKESTMMLQLAPTKTRISDILSIGKGTPGEKQVQGFKKEYKEFVIDLMYALDICKQHLYEHYWEDGDVVVLDNIALLHAAALGANRTARDIGRRELWQTSIKNPLPVTKLHQYVHA